MDRQILSKGVSNAPMFTVGAGDNERMKGNTRLTALIRGGAGCER